MADIDFGLQMVLGDFVSRLKATRDLAEQENIHKELLMQLSLLGISDAQKKAALQYVRDESGVDSSKRVNVTAEKKWWQLWK